MREIGGKRREPSGSLKRHLQWEKKAGDWGSQEEAEAAELGLRKVRVQSPFLVVIAVEG